MNAIEHTIGDTGEDIGSEDIGSSLLSSFSNKNHDDGCLRENDWVLWPALRSSYQRVDRIHGGPPATNCHAGIVVYYKVSCARN